MLCVNVEEASAVTWIVTARTRYGRTGAVMYVDRRWGVDVLDCAIRLTVARALSREGQE